MSKTPLTIIAPAPGPLLVPSSVNLANTISRMMAIASNRMPPARAEIFPAENVDAFLDGSGNRPVCGIKSCVSMPQLGQGTVSPARSASNSRDWLQCWHLHLTRNVFITLANNPSVELSGFLLGLVV